RRFAALRAQVPNRLERQLFRSGGQLGARFLVRIVGRFIEIFLHYLGHTVRQTAHTRRAEANRLVAADALQLVDNLLQAFAWLDGRCDAQDQRTETTKRLGHGSSLGSRLRRADKELKWLTAPFTVLVDRDVGRAKRRTDAIGMPIQAARA